ncbi:type II restriction enzyme [Leptolyngbya sp. NIES-3755]|nr:type II restriction enzyme [Leptolyngbya sp. NIES-3755]
MTPSDAARIEPFIDRWQNSSGNERANYQMFFSELCDALGVSRPDVKGSVPGDPYCFDKDITIYHPSGKKTAGYIDVYKAEHFLIEAKQGSDRSNKGTAKRGTNAYLKAMEAAFVQAIAYTRNLSSKPPFLLTCDIGDHFELWLGFNGDYGGYGARREIALTDLRNEETFDLFVDIFTDPQKRNPEKIAAKVTREVAADLAELSRRLEGVHEAQEVAAFLMRCIFTMFAEDVGLLKEHLFTQALETRWKANPKSFQPEVESLWQAMNDGTTFGFYGRLLRFNGGLFAEAKAFELGESQLEVLLTAAKREWKEVEPAIFGTLLERALDSRERSKLGAHYTPRSYVERLVRPVVLEPLREQWDLVQLEVKQALNNGELEPTEKQKKKAIDILEAFLKELREVKILDPACGSGNFLYVTLDLLKGLESEVLKRLSDVVGGEQLRIDDFQVNPSQFLGIEINPRAAAIADLVIWIGYLQWHFKRFGDIPPVEPVLREYKNIECRDAVLAYDGMEPEIDKATGEVRTRWGGRMMKSPVTGEEVPDPSDRIPIYRYLNPRSAEWLPSPLAPLPEGEGDKKNAVRLPSPLGRRVGDEGIDQLAGRTRQIPAVLLQRARELRQQQTPAEQLLWECLRNRQLCNAKFRRQHNLGQFIADFYCHEALLVIELDGGIHEQQKQRDDDRDQWMQAQGFTVLRFQNEEVFKDTEMVLEQIARCLPSPLAPLPEGEGDKKNAVRLPSPPGRRVGDEGKVYIVSNPPFIGNAWIRERLGDGYAEALRRVYKDVPDTVDFVMYWWHKAAELARENRIVRFGFITTNSIHQVRQRKVIEFHQNQKNPIQLIFAIADHPWVDKGAAVRIAMTIGQSDSSNVVRVPQLGTVIQEINARTPEDSAEQVHIQVTNASQISSDLKADIALTRSYALQANSKLSSRGMEMRGAGFLLTAKEAVSVGYDEINRTPKVIKRYLNGRDITDISRNLYTIDLFGLSIQEIQDHYPEMYQWVYERVKPERDANRRKASREKWWVYGEARATFRPALANLKRYIATVETAKHRTFLFLENDIVPDNKLVVIALEDAYFLGVLSSKIHIIWSLAAGGRLGFGNDPVYVKTRCFDPFPFPEATDAQKQTIRDLAERLDSHRKRVQAQHPEVTITAMYNLLEKIRAGQELTDLDRAFNQKALVSTLKQIHDDLDTAVFAAYNWSLTLTDDQILENLVTLNAQRAEEERNGFIRWLRPDYQAPNETQTQQTLQGITDPEIETTIAPIEQQKLPKAFKDQLAAVRDLLRTQGGEWSIEQITAQFKNATRQKQTILTCLESLEALGIVARHGEENSDRWYFAELQKVS